MKKNLFYSLLLFVSAIANAQQPTIDGDLMLCPDTNGTAGPVTDMPYDSYQWYADTYPYDEFVLLEGATEPAFTYDWMTYDQAKLKLVVTLDGVTYESNILQIDSHQWGSMFLTAELTEQVVFDDVNEVWVLCEGAGFTNTVQSPYTQNIQWFKDGVAIDGATNSSYTIVEAGSYTVVASPAVCPESSAESLPIIVTMKNCDLGTNIPDAAAGFTLYPNPVGSQVHLVVTEGDFKHYQIFDVTGKALLSGTINISSPEINVAALEKGTYIIRLSGEQAKESKLFIKQ